MSSCSSVSSVSSIASVSSIQLSSSDESDDHRATKPRRQKRVFKQRNNPFDTCNDRDFKTRFRLSKHTALVVLDLIKEHIEPFTQRNRPISAMNQLLMTLRFYACGSFHQIVIGDNFNATKQTVSRIIHKVTHRLATLSGEYINMAATCHQDQNKICADFHKIRSFPNVIGAIGCTHIRIQSPGGENAETFRNSDGWFSIKVQIICDATMRIMDVVTQFPGSARNDDIYHNSTIKVRLENGEFTNCVLLGGRGYVCRDCLLTPLVSPVTEPELRYNEALLQTWNVFERTCGALKKRFPCLTFGLRIPVEKTLPVIVATCILHNIARNLGDVDGYGDDVVDLHDIDVEPFFDCFNSVRNNVINTFFDEK